MILHRLRLGIAAASVLAIAGSPAAAEIEKIMRVCDGKLCPFFKTSFTPRDGWVEDKENGQRLNILGFVPRGQTFHSAGAIIYATARFNPDKKPVDAFIETDQANWRQKARDVTITRRDDVARANGKEPFRNFQYVAPSLKAQPFERVATTSDTDKDGNAYVVGLILTAKSEKALTAAEPTFLGMLKAFEFPED